MEDLSDEILQGWHDQRLDLHRGHLQVPRRRIPATRRLVDRARLDSTFSGITYKAGRWFEVDNGFQRVCLGLLGSTHGALSVGVRAAQVNSMGTALHECLSPQVQSNIPIQSRAPKSDQPPLPPSVCRKVDAMKLDLDTERRQRLAREEDARSRPGSQEGCRYHQTPSTMSRAPYLSGPPSPFRNMLAI